MKQVICCEECGSTNVVRDATADWDKETQDWVLRAVYDDTQCDSEACQGAEVHIVAPDESEIVECHGCHEEFYIAYLDAKKQETEILLCKTCYGEGWEGP